jgi:hypothetical protein
VSSLAPSETHSSNLNTASQSLYLYIVSGSVQIDRARWHRLELWFKGHQITAQLDGKLLTTVENDAHTHGMIALGTE